MTVQVGTPIEIFISYADEDKDLKKKLDTHLSSLLYSNIIKTWSHDDILPGSEREKEIIQHLNSAIIILILMSADYMASDRIFDIELRGALERHNKGDARVIILYLRAVDFKYADLEQLPLLPENGRAVTSWTNRDDAFADITKSIQTAIKEIQNGQIIPVKARVPASSDTNASSSSQSPRRRVNTSSQSSGSSAMPQSPSSSQSSNIAQVQQSSPNTNSQVSASTTSANATSPNQSASISKEGTPDAMKVTTDKAVRKLADDMLKFAIWVNALKNFIVSEDTTTPLTIGIDGPWGTGKSSFMYMLQDQLEPARTPWQKLRERAWPWFVWLILFLTTLPAWWLCQLLVWSGKRIKGGQLNWVQEMSKALSYDPEIDIDVRLNTLPWYKSITARIAGLHCPRQPLSHPTVWFNAWKYEQDEQLWAALALTTLDQIKKKYNLFQRVWFWIRLTYKRSSPINALLYFTLKAFPLILGLIAWQFDLALKIAGGVYHGNLNAFTSFIPLSQTILWIGAGVTAFLQIASIYKDPFQIPVKRVFDKPDYKERVGFIGNFEEDFAAIVSLITQPRLGWKSRKLIIFIDDLDRCKPPKAVDVIEGINLFLDSEQCVFVIGMDTTAVIASIETKYESLFRQIQRERPNIVSPGRFFLDKIIQVPIHVPSVTEKGIENLVRGIIEQGIRPMQETRVTISSNRSNVPVGAGNQVRPSSAANGATNTVTSGISNNSQAGTLVATNGTVNTGTSTGSLSPSQTQQAINVNRASYSHEEVRSAILFGTSLLAVNPRQVKRFINLFRLYIYVANEQQMFEEELQVGLNMDRLAAWVAWSIRWGDLIRYLSEEIQLSESGLVDYLQRIAKSLEKEGCWIKSSPDASGVPTDPAQVLYTFIQGIAQKQNGTTLHWSHLPWDVWFRDPNFLKSVKKLESFWQPSSSKTNWLSTMVLMTKITSTTNLNQTASTTSAADGLLSL